MTIKNFLLLLITVVFSFVSQVFADPLPDMTPNVYQLSLDRNQTVDPADVIEGCAAAETGRTLLRFSLDSMNIGAGDLNLGDPLCPDCYYNPGLTCGNPLFECSAAGGHGHPHAYGFANYELVSASNGAIINGHKEGFCLVDSYCNEEVIADPEEPYCSTLHAGCADVYPSGIGCQYIDATGVEPGKYTLKVELNSLRNFVEADYTNNVVEIPIKICNPNNTLRLKISKPLEELDGDRRVSVSTQLPFKIKARSFNPKKTGISFNLLLDGYEALRADLPAGGVKNGCAPEDGWRKINKNEWIYKNKYGLAGANCEYYLSGARSFKIKVNPVSNIAKVEFLGELPINFVTADFSSASFTVTGLSSNSEMITELGCGASEATLCRRIGEGNKGYSCS